MAESMREILAKVERGELTPEEAEAILGGEASTAQPSSPAEEVPPVEGEVLESPAEVDARLKRWRLWWLVPLGIGGFILVVGIALITLGYASSSPFWFICGFFPLFLGLIVALLAVWSRQARWLHLRVREKREKSLTYDFTFRRVRPEPAAEVARGSITTVCVARDAEGRMKAVPIPEEVARMIEVAR